MKAKTINTQTTKTQQNFQESLLKTTDSTLKTLKMFSYVRIFLVIVSILFLGNHINEMDYDWNFWVWIFNFVFNGSFLIFYDKKHIEETTKKRFELLKQVDKEQWLKEMRLKKLRRIRKFFY